MRARVQEHVYCMFVKLNIVMLFPSSASLETALYKGVGAVSPLSGDRASGHARITKEILALQNSVTSQTVLEAYADDQRFKALSNRLYQQILQRDAEDRDKLQKGIQLAIAKGVLPRAVSVDSTTKVSVTGQTVDQIADAIIDHLGEAPSRGCIVTVQGLSGTGKGTTVAKLKDKLPNARTWSLGNLFRSYTLLAVTYAEQNHCELSEALKPDMLAWFGTMLSFEKFDDKFDIRIDGLGLRYRVSDVQNTVLKEPRISSNIPRVAQMTQGEVISFVQVALQKLAADGVNVLVDGREQTLRYIRTPHRFELTLADPAVIGMRQAALIVAANGYEKVCHRRDADVRAALDESLTAFLSTPFPSKTISSRLSA
eukprot:TRINITY_DN22124_c0_g1_i2.p1 TRINITY_DN22124_c0_g1~~TRINITY_DN22124_c0_g1_i2.p1  ORF type:complete len:370 (+),score=55.13 TRINITY_DN22124_c0_g1_i2:119-1228(+)